MSGIAMLLASALISAEPFELDRSILWAAAAGLAGSGGIVALYRGLAIGSAATVAPLAAVTAAVIPVLFTATTVGLPRLVQLAGFALALIGIWLVSRSASERPASREGVKLGALAGVGSVGPDPDRAGGGQRCLRPADCRARDDAGDRDCHLVGAARGVSGHVVQPHRITGRRARCRRQRPLPAGATAHPPRHRRGALSVYPVSTVILARAITHEPVTPMQWLGAGLPCGGRADHRLTRNIAGPVSRRRPQPRTFRSAGPRGL